MANLQLDLNQSLDLRIAQFKNDPEKMAEVNDFLSDVFEKAQKEAEQRSDGNKSKGKLMGVKKSERGQIGLNHLRDFLQPAFLPPYVIVPIQCGVLLLLATIVIKKIIQKSSSTT
ncbi:hypothetical protein GWI33_001799 [Rhynchophorus ferrugineus]|uniref:Uncharacterized protein n=1 Tax=Rhynchophorus ferrugineus TaxID=354439 RepID=A0A834IRU5_RHYFE|nr:hypothetical protein GWI33_001799 [Rhynchophorus ferrugineus]